MERSFQVHFRCDFVIIGVALTVLGQLWEPFGVPWAVLVHLLGQALARGGLDSSWRGSELYNISKMSFLALIPGSPGSGVRSYGSGPPFHTRWGSG